MSSRHSYANQAEREFKLSFLYVCFLSFIPLILFHTFQPPCGILYTIISPWKGNICIRKKSAILMNIDSSSVKLSIGCKLDWMRTNSWRHQVGSWRPESVKQNIRRHRGGPEEVEPSLWRPISQPTSALPSGSEVDCLHRVAGLWRPYVCREMPFNFSTDIGRYDSQAALSSKLLSIWKNSLCLILLVLKYDQAMSTH